MNQPVVHVGDRSLRSESGIALIISLMAMLFMMALGSVLMLSTATETKIANNFRNSSEALYAADAGLEGFLTQPLRSAPADAAERIALVLALTRARADIVVTSGLRPLESDAFRDWVRERTEHALREGAAFVELGLSSDAFVTAPQRLLRIRAGKAVAIGHPASVEAL